MVYNPSFTRTPSTKVGVSVVQTGLTAALNTLVIIGHMASSGSTATAYVPYTVENFGDPVAVVAEMTTQFGSSSEISAMVVAAIEANADEEDDQSVVFPPIVVIPLAHADTDVNLALTPNINYPMPYLAVWFDANDSTNSGKLKTFLGTISGDDRGQNGQFGSFAGMGTMDSSSEAPGYGTSAASQNILIGWLRDSAEETANTSAEIAAWMMALVAGNPVPYNPMNGIGGGGLTAPGSKSDWHTPGDSGTEEIGLAAGIIPLMTYPDGTIHLSRTVTTYNTSTEVPSAAYYDYQDWAVLYYYRQNAWETAQGANYKNVKASQQKIKSLRSDLIALAKDFEELDMFQYVDSLVSQWTITIPEDDRYAAVYQVPVNVVPGFMNKGIGVLGTTQFDQFVIS
jgi:phage tail sheath gpL-like